MNSNKKHVDNETFEKLDYSVDGFAKGEYENCVFKNCELSNADLSGVIFIDCDFKDCNLSMAKIDNAAFRDVKFKNCKQVGLHFHTCNQLLFSASFEDCNLNLSSFHKIKLKNTKFKNCSLHEVDFGFSDGAGVVFEKCDLLNAMFENTVLEKADFRTAINYNINPDGNKIKGAKFSLQGVQGLLMKYGIIIE